MTVFLRWGVFGILAVAALLYAYNASKDLARKRQASSEPVVSQGDSSADETESGEQETAESEPEPELTAEAEPAMPSVCEDEKLVAERALKFRRDGEPLDRLLRIQVIAFQDDEKRRERLEAVARRWYERDGRDPNAAVLRAEVLRECRNAAPAP